ncbi:hypothetical protein L7F22_004828 [Adiantum nelumboides]|nr:hypothetical protein [Adiantum nelumboides]
MVMTVEGGTAIQTPIMLLPALLLPQLLLLFIIMLNHWPSPSCTARSGSISVDHYAAALHKSKSGGSKSKAFKRKGHVKIGGTASASALIITAIIIAAIVVLIAAYWWWQRRQARTHVKETEKLATRKYSIGAHARDIGEPVRLFSFTEVNRATNGFASDRLLGRGSFGDVYKGTLDDETQVSIKSVKTNSIQGKDQLLSEVEALSKVSHPNLVHLLGFCIRWRRLLLVYEYVPNGSLSGQLARLKDADTSTLDWKTRLQIALQSAEALAYLHSEGPIYHGNVISNNILLDHSMNAKLSDYGLSRFGSRKPDSNLASKPVLFLRKWPWINIGVRRKSPGTSAQSQVGTSAQSQVESAYLDLEYPNNNMNQRTDKSDVYSFGVVLLELVTSERALTFSSGHEDSLNLAEMVRVEKERGKLDGVLDAELLRGASEATVLSMRTVVDLALECLREDGGSRTLMEEIVERLRKIMASLEEPHPDERG